MPSGGLVHESSRRIYKITPNHIVKWVLKERQHLDEKLRETGSATATPHLENLLAKPLPEQNPLNETMHTSPFISSEPVLLGVLGSSEEYDSEDSLHFCEDEHSSSPRLSLSLFPLAQNILFSTLIEMQP